MPVSLLPEFFEAVRLLPGHQTQLVIRAGLLWGLLVLPSSDLGGRHDSWLN